MSAADSMRISHTPPVSVLFAAFLGYNPIQQLAGAHVLGTLSAHNAAIVTGQTFFPQLIAGPFRTGLHEAFAFAIVACLVAAGASALRGGKYQHDDESEQKEPREEQHAHPVVRTVGVRADERRNVPVR
jgi:hypothetical protein